MKFAKGQIVKFRGRWVRILNTYSGGMAPHYQVSILEQVKRYEHWRDSFKPGDITYIVERDLQPISALEQLAQQA